MFYSKLVVIEAVESWISDQEEFFAKAVVRY